MVIHILKLSGESHWQFFPSVTDRGTKNGQRNWKNALAYTLLKGEEKRYRRAKRAVLGCGIAHGKRENATYIHFFTEGMNRNRFCQDKGGDHVNHRMLVL